MKHLSNRWKDFPDYILGITKEIWEDRGIATLDHYYAKDIPVRSPMGLSRGNEAVKAATMATINEFPDRELLGDDVIWSDHEDHGLLSSHRLLTRATHTRDGQFGKATGTPWTIYVIADCATKDDTIYDEWLIRDYGGLVRQLGHDPQDFTQALIVQEGGPENAAPVFTPEIDVDGGYQGRGNDNEHGGRYADLLRRIMDTDFNAIHTDYDRAAQGHYAGASHLVGRDRMTEFWVGLRSSFPSAKFEIHHQIGMDGGDLSPRAAIRFSLNGIHDGWGSFGKPSGAKVHVMGLAHAEFGPWGLRREYALIDEVAIWKQILMHKG